MMLVGTLVEAYLLILASDTAILRLELRWLLVMLRAAGCAQLMRLVARIDVTLAAHELVCTALTWLFGQVPVT